MCKSRKQKRNIGKTWLLLLWNPHNKPYKKTYKFKNQLLIVFISFIKQKIIKLVCFFIKTLCFLIGYIKKKTTILIRTMIKNLLSHKSKTGLKTC